MIVGSDSSTPWGPTLNTSVRAEATLRESFPELAVVLAAGENLVRLDEGITSLEERRPAGLQLHSVDDKLSNESVSVLGNEGFEGTISIVLARSVEVASGDGPILLCQGGEEGVRETVLLDESLGDDPKHLSPDLADGVHTPVTWLVEGLVRRGVDGDILVMHVRCRTRCNTEKDLRWSKQSS